jgi:uncharacterized protein (TIGR02265 family)
VQQLEATLAQLPKNSTTLGYIFNKTLDCVVEQRGSEVAAEIQRRLLPKRPIALLRHSAHDYFKVMYACAHALDPDDLDAGLYTVGFECAAAFFQTPMGQMLLSLVGRGDPSRLMANEPAAYKTTFSFGTRVFKRLGPKEVECLHSEDLLPMPFNKGALMTAMKAIEVPTAKVTAVAAGPWSARYVIGW